MGEWQRLTPVNHQSNAGQWFRKVKGEKFDYEFAVSNLTNAEALAFAAQLPEVRALVKMVDTLLNEAIEVNEHVEDVPIELWDGVSATLRPFKDLINV
jgi:hypothetical protein